MKSAQKPLTKAYKQILAGLRYNDQPVPVFIRMAPDKGVPSLYVILGPWTPQNSNTKDTFGEKGTIVVDVICRFDSGIINIEPTATVAELITDRLKPTPDAQVLSVEGFDCWSTVIESVMELTAPTAADRIHRSVITISHQLEEIS